MAAITLKEAYDKATQGPLRVQASAMGCAKVLTQAGHTFIHMGAVNSALLAHAFNVLPDTVGCLNEIADAAQAVIDNWEKGDLAEAVRNLDCWITAARETSAVASTVEVPE